MAAPVRGTQTFVGTLSACWRRPGLTALEVAWRWAYGIPAAAAVLWFARRALLAATGGVADPARLGLDATLLSDPVGALSADPMLAAGKFARAWAAVWPGLEHVGVWLVPLLVLAWVVASALGRTALLRRIEPSMHARVGTLMVLHALRVLALAAVLSVWCWCVARSGSFAVTGPIAAGQEPNLVLYCGLLIVLTLVFFVAWGTVSWVLVMAPLVAMQRGSSGQSGAGASLAATLRLGELRGKLVEVNLVMGIVKIALIVLAMVFSATPLPFESVTSQAFLLCWWAGVGVVYLLASDFFHVARLLAYLSLSRAEGDT